MHLPKFTFERPESSEEAARLLKVREESQLVAGGTELFPRMKYGLCSPEIIISLKGSRISQPEVTPEGMLILDAKMSLTAINNSPVIQEYAPPSGHGSRQGGHPRNQEYGDPRRKSLSGNPVSLF